MAWDTTAELATTTEVVNDSGTVVRTPSWRTVYVNEKDISQTEHYQAAAVGLKPDIKLEMRRTDYFNETRLRYEGKEYDVVRSFAPNRDFIELVLRGITNKEQLRGNT